MSLEVSRVVSLRKVLEAAGQGSGLSRSIVEELGRGEGPEKEAARLVLLGNPISAAVGPLLKSASDEVSMLASLIASAQKSSTSMVGKTGGQLAAILEGWVKLRESRNLEMKVMKFRSLITSGVLGAVAAMLSSMGPLVGSFGLGAAAATGPSMLGYGAAAMTAISSGMLGLFMSGKGFYANVVVSLAAFAVVSAAAAPLASVAPGTLLGVI